MLIEAHPLSPLPCRSLDEGTWQVRVLLSRFLVLTYGGLGIDYDHGRIAGYPGLVVAGRCRRCSWPSRVAGWLADEDVDLPRSWRRCSTTGVVAVHDGGGLICATGVGR